MNRRVATHRAPTALGPYSQGIDDRAHVFVSGQVGIDPATGSVADGIVNDIDARFVGDPPPARSAPIVAGIARGFLISIEVIAKR